MIGISDFLHLSGMIDPFYFSEYLAINGWKSVKRKRQDIKVFQITQGESFFQVTIPFDTALSDYKEAMLESVKTVADVEKKTVEQVLTYLSNPDSDLLKIHIEKDDITHGSILIDDAINVFEGVKKLLWATAQDVIKPSVIHRGRVDSMVSDFLSKCRFGQTEVGSYVVSVVCPLISPDEEQPQLFNITNYQNSFTRRVTSKVMKAISEVKTQIDSGSFLSSVNDDNDQISVNFYEALISMNLADKDTTIELESFWSSKEPVIEGVPSTVSLNHSYYDSIDSAISKIKDKDSAQTVSIIGRIKKLEASPDLGKREVGKISVVYLSAENKVRTISASLTKKDYDNAIEAHSKGVSCKLVGKYVDGRSKEIVCDSFEILE